MKNFLQHEGIQQGQVPESTLLGPCPMAECGIPSIHTRPGTAMVGRDTGRRFDMGWSGHQDRGMKILSTNRWITWVAVLMSAATGWAEEKSDSRDLPAELLDLTAKYQDAMTKAEEPLTSLTTFYTERVSELKESAISAGNLQAAVTIEKELANAKKGEPGRDSEITPLADLQRTYHEHARAALSRVGPERIRLESAYVDALEKLMTTYTREGDLDAGIVTRRAHDAARARLEEWKEMADLDPSEKSAFDWDRLAKLWEKKPFVTTAAVGGSTQLRTRDREILEEPVVLTGFVLHFTAFGDSNKTVRGATPIYQNREGRQIEGQPRSTVAIEKRGSRRRVTAKDGYAVCGLKAVSEGAIRTLTITFGRLKDKGVDMSDTYESETYGDWEGGTTTSVSVDGAVPVGIDGFYGTGLDQLAIITTEP
ncbi:MAG: hypothetical protein KDN19_17035 [Verrucomicrobiae bacterium]|nr:hypothetical protein [Verrucomicrobiae bacterium]